MKITSSILANSFEVRRNDIPKEFFSYYTKVMSKLEYREATIPEYKEYIAEVTRKTESSRSTVDALENMKIWDRGWDENLESMDLKPKYFRPSKFLRYNDKLIISKNTDLQYDLFTLVRYIIFGKYLSQVNNVYEFGCGSCNNLVMLRELFPNKRLWGFDWSQSSVEIGRKISINVGKFDMLDPIDMEIPESTGFVTIHAMEQLGINHEKFLEFIIKKQPVIVVHYEPIMELYNGASFFDRMAIEYLKKRKYLSGYLPKLQELERHNEIDIMEVNRPYIGGIIHEASLVVWRPK